MQQGVSKEELEAFSQQSILFAHQSVGREIIAGVRDLAAQHGVTINVHETRTLAPQLPGIHHFRVGKNRNPALKIDDYISVWSENSAASPDIAMLKLCYIDISRETDGKKLAHDYATALENLQARFPNTKFIAVTAPLTTIQTGPKAWFTKVFGKQPEGYEENAQRQEFNSVLRKRYGKDQLFDIAAIESTNGTRRTTFVWRDQAIEMLRPDFTYDGGHLNEHGRQAVAAALVKLIASAKPRS